METKWVLRVSMVMVLCGFGAGSAQAQTYGGAATGAQVTVPSTGTVIRAATGTLSISGGGAHASLQAGDIPGSATGGVVSLAAGTLHSAIVGLMATGGGASMSNVNLTVSGNTISADFVMARSTATCSPAATGTTQIQNLVINGQNITVSGSPNQTVNLANGTVIINKQTSSVGGSAASITTDALNVTTTDAITHQQLANVVLATVNSQIDCSGGSQPNETWTTGGGWVPLGASKATFGVSGGVKQNGLDGHLVYQDHNISFRIKDIAITGVTTGSCATTISGSGQSDDGSVDFTVDVTDSSSGDTFGIQATGPGVPGGAYGYAPIPLGGGNIKIHDQACS